MTEKLPTGVEILDRKLDGGIPPGRAVVLSASPTSQSELFLYEVASVRETIYLTTERSELAVRDVLEQTGADVDSIDIHALGDDPLSEAEAAITDLPDRSAVIVDPMKLLELEEGASYQNFLNDLRHRIDQSDSIAFFHCLDRRSVPDSRDTTEYMADIIFDLSTDVRGDTLENRLVVPKFRGGQALEDMIKLNLTAEVTIDISRKIA